MPLPDDWPKGCPPDDAEPAAGEVFRLVRSDPHTQGVFRTHHETGKLPKAPPCIRCGLSVFRSRQDAEHQYRAYPKLGRFIARASLPSTHGVTKLTEGRQPSHTTWWPFAGVDRAAIFAILEELRQVWDVPGKAVSAKVFEPFEPVEVLYDFDGPRTFTVLDRDGALCLAHWCDEDDSATRCLVVPFTDQLLGRLRAGELTLRDALNQPRVWVLDFSHEGKVLAAWLVQLGNLPPGVLPQPDTMLLPSLQPLLSLRATAVEGPAGVVPGSLIRAVVDGAQKAIKLLAEYVLDQPAQPGRPAALVRRLFDLPAQRLAFGSFEIAFRSPLAGPPGLFPALTAEEISEETAALQRVGLLLERGLEWATSDQVPPDYSEAKAPNPGRPPR
jgi:hypothetical protein